MRDNVHAFGGDPARVTVLGQSSGGTSIVGLLASPASRGLIHAAVSLSASPNVSIGLRDAQRAFDEAFRVSPVVGPNCTTAECLLALPAATVASILPPSFDVSPALPLSRRGQGYPGLVVVDGVTVVVDGVTALLRGIVDVPLLLQTELAEMDT